MNDCTINISVIAIKLGKNTTSCHCPRRHSIDLDLEHSFNSAYRDYKRTFAHCHTLLAIDCFGFWMEVACE